MCAIASKSPMKHIKTGKMFSMTITDEDPTSFIRAVCFNDQLFSSLEVHKTYRLKSFKVQKGYGKQSGNLEVVLDNTSNVELSPKQFAVKPVFLNVASILRSTDNSMPFVNTKGKITRTEEPNLVGSPPDSKMKRIVYLTDATGSLNVAFWKDQALKINFKLGNVVNVENLRLSTWNGMVTGNASPETSFVTIDKEIQITQAVLPKPSNIISLDTSIKAIKDYSVTSKCVNCKTTPHLSSPGMVTVCEKCNTTYLKENCRKDACCMLLLTEPRRQWYTAFTQVLSLFYILQIQV